MKLNQSIVDSTIKIFNVYWKTVKKYGAMTGNERIYLCDCQEKYDKATKKKDKKTLIIIYVGLDFDTLSITKNLIDKKIYIASEDELFIYALKKITKNIKEELNIWHYDSSIG